MITSNPLTTKRSAIATLTMSAAGFAFWLASEGFSAKPYIPTKGDVPTIGHGSTHYENGARVKLSDPAITRSRAAQLARNLANKDEQQFRQSLPDVKLHQEEYDLYLDFVGQYGASNWNKSSMRKRLLAGEYQQACDALLAWRFQDGRDCKNPKNWGVNGCKGVWTRQQIRYQKCIAAQE
jgi:GH24 family phage-related lysozyme (muramidase)